MQSFNFTFRQQKWETICINCVINGACDCDSHYVYKLGIGDIIGMSFGLFVLLLFLCALSVLIWECYRKNDEPNNILRNDRDNAMAELKTRAGQPMFNMNTRNETTSIQNNPENGDTTAPELETYQTG